YGCGPSGSVGRHGAWSASALVVLLVATMAISAGTATARGPSPFASPSGALLVTFDIQVDAGAADYVQRAAQAAIASNQDLVIVMNTPGGLLANMQQIVTSIQDVQSHGLAVYTFVPPVAFAASAGSYIALASNALSIGRSSCWARGKEWAGGGRWSE